MDLEPIFSALVCRGLSIANRFVMAPMTRGFCPQGVPGADIAAYYARRAEGGVGLIITEGVGVPHPASLGESEVDSGSIPVLDAASLDGWRAVVEAVHAAGGRIAPQLWHQGGVRRDGTGPYPDALSCRPSGLWGPLDDRTRNFSPDYLAQVAAPTDPMSEETIADVIHAFGTAARHARDLGFDAVAIHGAHGYLVDMFLWAETNHRGDAWGGTVAGRSRFAAELVRAVRREVGEAMPILFRFSQWKLQDFRARLAENPAQLETMLAPLAEAGVDVFDASARYFDRPAFDGSPLSLAGWARQVTGKLSMTVGGVGLSGGMYESRRSGGAATSNNLDRVAARFEAGEFDLVGVGRALLNDPAWVAKVRAGAPLQAYDEGKRKVLI